MNCKKILFLLLLIAVTLLTGCSMRTIDQMYCLPERSEDYLNLQTAINEAMAGLEYNAPISGDNRQTIQTADLDGDGDMEYLLFAKGNDEKPLKILIFTCTDGSYTLTDTLAGAGTAFDQVHYVRMSGGKGYQLVVGRQVSDQIVRPFSVYTMVGSHMEQVLTTSYSRLVPTDLNEDNKNELMVLHPGDDPGSNGVAELYTMENGVVERSPEIAMSKPVENIKRVMVSKLNDGLPAVYVASDVDGTAIITDVYAIVDKAFTNVSFSNESGTSVQTLRNYYVYADDLDKDGALELPSLIPMQTIENSTQDTQYLIRWYAMTSDGAEVDKLYTYHNFVGKWYVELPKKVVNRVTVNQLGNSYEFVIQENDGTTNRLMTIYVFTGQNREEQAVSDNRFVLYRNESTVYAAHLDVTSTAYNMTRESLIDAFRLITDDWKTEET